MTETLAQMLQAIEKDLHESGELELGHGIYNLSFDGNFSKDEPNPLSNDFRKFHGGEEYDSAGELFDYNRDDIGNDVSYYQSISILELARKFRDGLENKGIDITSASDIQKVMAYDHNPEELADIEFGMWLAANSLSTNPYMDEYQQRKVFKLRVTEPDSPLSKRIIEYGRHMLGDTFPGITTVDTLQTNPDGSVGSYTGEKYSHNGYYPESSPYHGLPCHVGGDLNDGFETARKDCVGTHQTR